MSDRFRRDIPVDLSSISLHYTLGTIPGQSSQRERYRLPHLSESHTVTPYSDPDFRQTVRGLTRPTRASMMAAKGACHPVATIQIEYSNPARAAGMPSFSTYLALRRLVALALIIPLLVACNRQSDSQTVPVQPMVGVVASPTTLPQADSEIIDLLDEPVPADSEADSEELDPAGLGPEVQDVAPILVPTATTEQPDLEPTDPLTGRVTAALVNVRANPSKDGVVVATVSGGQRLMVLEISADEAWLLICCVDDDASNYWINAEFVDVETSASIAAVEPLTGAPSGTVTADLVNVRGGPGTNFPVVGQSNRDRTLTLVAQDQAGSWLRVCCISADPAVETWLSAEFIQPSASLASVPVEAGPAPPPVAIGGSTTASSRDQAAALAAAPAPGLPGLGGFGAPGAVNPFTGLSLGGDRASRRPVIVCINNDYAARPQLGIGQADVMYEYLMEGFGITRFSGVFFGEDVGQIGPVRSARLINYYLGGLYDAGLACSGASDRVRYTLKHESPFPYLDIDLDDPSNTRYSVSVGSDYRTRLRTSTAGLMRWLDEWGVQQPAAVRGFTFGSASGGAPARQVSIPYPTGTGSQVSYRFDDGSGRYLRNLGGTPHLDGNTGAQIAVENVIVQYVPHQVTDIVEDSLGSLSIRLNLFGSGRAIVFRDGKAFEAVWRSDSRGDLPRFYAADGSELALKPGRLWISVVPIDYSVSYQ